MPKIIKWFSICHCVNILIGNKMFASYISTAIKASGHLLLSNQENLRVNISIEHNNNSEHNLSPLQCELLPRSPCTALVHGYTPPGVLWAVILLKSVWYLRWSGSMQPTGAPGAHWDASHRDGPAQISGTLQDEHQAAQTLTTDIYVSELNFHPNKIQYLNVH